MSGVRGLFREAGRAAAFMRRLERSLEPARRAVSASAEVTLLRVDQRLAGLTDLVDVSSALDSVMGRLAATPSGDQQHTRVARRVDPEMHANDGRRQSMPDEVSRATRHVARSRQTDAGQASAVLRQASTTIVPPQHTRVAVGAARAADRRAFEPPHSADAAPAMTPGAIQALPADAFRPSPVALRAHAVVESLAVAESNNSLTTAAGNRIPYVSASHATAILSERLRASNALDAFRSVVRAEPSTRAERQRPGSTAVVGRSFPAEPVAASAPSVVRVRETAPLLELASAAAEALTVSDRGEETAHAGRRRTPAPVVGSTLSGLRRLAALATTSLDDPRPAAEPLPSSQPVVGVEEALDRILRAEALRYGIGVDRWVR